MPHLRSQPHQATAFRLGELLGALSLRSLWATAVALQQAEILAEAKCRAQGTRHSQIFNKYVVTATYQFANQNYVELTRMTTLAKTDTFVQDLEKFLEHYKSITSAQRDTAIAVIREKARKSKAQTGKCLNCKQVTEYSSICKVHLARGDSWLENRILGWERPARIQVRSKSVFSIAETEFLINDLIAETVFSYCCGECVQELRLKCNSALQDFLEFQNRQRIAESERDAAIIKGEIKATPARRYRTLCKSRFSEEVVQSLKEMPYRQFLKTLYWEIVRDYVRDKRKVCELCSSSRQLQVHHRSYKNHGDEHQHLEDLVLLCAFCHERHHQKGGASC